MNNPIRLILASTCLLSLAAFAPTATLAAAPAAVPATATPDDPAAQVLDSLRQVTLALKDGSPTQIDRWVHVGSSVEDRLARAVVLQDAALSRLDRAWSKRFGGVYPFKGAVHVFEHVRGGLECLLESALGELQNDDVAIEGDTAQVMLDLRRDDPDGDAQHFFGNWSDAVIHMVRVEGQWKLDLPKTLSGTVVLTARPSFVPGKAPSSRNERLSRDLAFREQSIAGAGDLIRKLEAGEFAGPLAARTFILQETQRLLAANGLTSDSCDIEPAK